MLQKEEKDDADSLNFLDMNIWKIKEEFLTDDIMNNIKKNTNNIRILTEVLSDEEKHDKKKKIKNYQSFDGLGKRCKNKDSKISKNVKKIMSDVGKLVLDMKTISENSYKENIKSLRKTTNEIKKTEIIPEKKEDGTGAKLSDNFTSEYVSSDTEIKDSTKDRFSNISENYDTSTNTYTLTIKKTYEFWAIFSPNNQDFNLNFKLSSIDEFFYC